LSGPIASNDAEEVRTGEREQHRVVAVRHGETGWSRDLRHTGRTDVPLTARGRDQARRLASALGSWTFAAVYTSPLQRARDTCRLAGFGAEAVVDAHLMEWDYGDYEGRTSAAIHSERPDWDLWRDGVPGGESLDHVARRAEQVLGRIRGVTGDVLLFGHGHMLRVLTATWLDLAPAQAQHFFLSAGAFGVLGYEHTWSALRQWNVGGT
jgi:probable phosphoglycerate mutase